MQCTAQDATCIIDPNLNWGPSTNCTYNVYGCTDAGGTQTWGTIGPFTHGAGTGINGQL